MRTFCIEFADEGVETSLLLQHVHARRPCGFLLQCQVHALVLAVLLRMAGLAKFDGDAQPQPPDGELRQIVKTVRAGEGHAVVAADCVWQTTLGKQPAKGLDDGKLLVRRKGFAGKKIA